MKTSLDHLSPRRQAELAHIREIILEELQAKIASAGSARSGRYKLLKLILFGSFAKGTWFDDKHSGRASDFDLLVIVSHRELTDMSAFWEEVEERLFTDPLVKRDVSLIVHTLPDVNRQLKDGQYFFSEIVNQGILLFEDSELGKDGKAKNILAKPGTPDRLRAHEMGSRYHQSGYKSSKLFLEAARHHVSATETVRQNFAAFQLHQAAEGAYRMFLLAVTLYAPGTHHLGKLRNLAQMIDERLEEAWAPPQRPYKRYFELLRRAYVEARYSEAYETTKEILNWQAERVERLIEVADALCIERLARLKSEGAVA
ncbi:MAG: HEPN domain-containing protein [Pannonibacter sp.]